MDATTTLPEFPQPSMWTSIREALRGSHQDYTSGDLNRAILLLAIPMVLEMVLESLFAVVDVFFVGRIGANAVATVGLTESLLSLMFAVAIGLSMSTTAMVARRIGEKDPDGGSVAGVQAIVLGLTVSLCVGVPCFIFAPRLLQLMGASPEILFKLFSSRNGPISRSSRHGAYLKFVRSSKNVPAISPKKAATTMGRAKPGGDHASSRDVPTKIATTIIGQNMVNNL